MQAVPSRPKFYKQGIAEGLPSQNIEPCNPRHTKTSPFASPDSPPVWPNIAATNEKLNAATMHPMNKKGPFGSKTSNAGTGQVYTSAQIVNNTQTSSTTSSRVAKASVSSSTSSSKTSRVHHHQQVTSSDLKASQMKADLNDFRSSISEMKTLSSNQTMNANQAFNQLRQSMEDLVDSNDGECEPLVTFPDSDTPPPLSGPVSVCSGSGVGIDTVKFEQKKMSSASSTKVITDGFSAEKTVANTADMKRLQAGDLSYQENSAGRAMHARVDMDGVTAEKSHIQKQEQSSLKAGEISQQESRNMAAVSMKVQSGMYSSDKSAMTAAQQRKTVTSQGILNQERLTQSSQANLMISSRSISTKSESSQLAQYQFLNNEDELMKMKFDDLENLSTGSNSQDIERAIQKYSSYLDVFVKILRQGDEVNNKRAPMILNRINDIMQRAWAVPTHGHELGYSLCNALRNCGGLDILMENCTKDDTDLQFSSARLLEQCLTTENRAHVVKNGLDKVVKLACICTKNANPPDYSRVGTGILEHLFKHSEETCSDVIRLGGLDAVLFECRKNDVETLRHCAGALANLSLYGGAENQEAMIKRKVPMWLFPLAFHNDDNIKYYACLAITVLVANIEIEAAVLNSGTLDLVEPFVTSHNPFEFAKSNLAHAHGQSKNWLQRLIPVLSSKREEARNLAAFHFCMEAGIKKQQGNTEIFREIGIIEPLKKVASCPNAVASKYAAQALRLIGEEVPHKLSQQVPLWSIEDVREWVKQIGFAEMAGNFVESRVDGDLLLQLTEENLKEDIGITNGIRRIRFTRELQNLKKMADYTSRDRANINSFLQSMGQEFSIYTYSMLNAGVDNFSLRSLSEDQLLKECGITNSIHRFRIMDAIKAQENCLANSSEENLDKSLDVFVSYRRSNGSQLASLLKVHLQLRGFSVFIDVERLEAGKFDNNLLQSIRQAKHFLLVLTSKALDRCEKDNDCKDWVHREIVAALQSQCNIIPIFDDFTWPKLENLPEDMRAVCHFNGVLWIHDYQDACVDKLERFMRGELSNIRTEPLTRNVGLNKGDGTPGTPSNPALARQPPSYQRMHSNDSGSGKGSDKDVNGNSGTSRD